MSTSCPPNITRVLKALLFLRLFCCVSWEGTILGIQVVRSLCQRFTTLMSIKTWSSRRPCPCCNVHSSQMHSYNGISLGRLPPEWEGAFTSQKWKEDVRANLIKVVLNTQEEYEDFKTKVKMKYIHKQTPSGRLVQNSCGEFGLHRLDKLHPGGSITYLSDFDRLSKFPATLFFLANGKQPPQRGVPPHRVPWLVGWSYRPFY